MDDSREWLLKRRHEDLSLTVRASWDLYMKFYTVFLTFSVVGLGWVLTRGGDAALTPRAQRVVAIVFFVQTVLTAITSGAMALYTVRVSQQQEGIEAALMKEQANARPPVQTAVPILLGQWAGWANCAAMLAMALLWVYVGLLG